MGRRTNSKHPPLVRFSAVLTGREGLLSIAVAADSAEPINATVVAAIAGVQVVAASRELRALEKIGFLRTVETDRANTDFEIVDAAAWSALQSLCAQGSRGVLIPTW